MKLNRNKIKLLLAEKLMMTKELCKISGISQVTLRRGYEKNISPLSAGKLAAALGVPVEEIVISEEG